MFGKFRRTEAPGDRKGGGHGGGGAKGVGLGLSISKGFIEAMGGRIAAASPIHGDRGTRVLVSLPKIAPGDEPAPGPPRMSPSRPHVLVIEDEAQTHRFLRPALDAAGYEPLRADTAADGLREIARRAPDAVLLDLGLPDMDGHEALARARAFYDGPIVIQAARDRETDEIEALDAGADDYVEKPFGVGEPLARLRVALRHRPVQAAGAPVVEAGDLSIDLVQRLVTRGPAPLRLSPKEYDLVARLVAGGGKVVTHRQLLTAVWGPAHAEDVQYLRVFVGQRRPKLEEDPAAPRLIAAELGVGYRFSA